MQCQQKMKRFLSDDTVLAFFKISSVWIPGLLLGLLFAGRSFKYFDAYLNAAVLVRCSLVGALISSSAVVVLSALFVKLLHWSSVYVFAFLEAFIFAFLSCCCLWNFQSAGWLVLELLLFANCCTVLVLLFFWVHVLVHKDTLSRVTLSVIAISVVIGCIDYLAISPFLVSLFD